MTVRHGKKPETAKPETKKEPVAPVNPTEHPLGKGKVVLPLRGQSSYGVVFVNSPGLDLYRDSESTKAFPVGTVIVRETRIEPEDETPRTVLAMIKRAKGFNPEGGDWEFIEADGLDLKIVKRQTTGSCLDCHRQAQTGNFVFRTAAEKQYQ